MNLSLLLPWENLTFRTNLTPAEIENQLLSVLKYESGIRFNSFFSNKPLTYSGEVNGNAFSLKRNISYRNSFLPLINGVISTDNYGTTVQIKMRLHLSVKVFLIIWVGFISFFIFSTFTQDEIWSTFSSVDFTSIGMLLFAFILTIGAFKYESLKAKNHLQEILNAAEV